MFVGVLASCDAEDSWVPYSTGIFENLRFLTRDRGICSDGCGLLERIPIFAPNIYEDFDAELLYDIRPHRTGAMNDAVAVRVTSGLRLVSISCSPNVVWERPCEFPDRCDVPTECAPPSRIEVGVEGAAEGWNRLEVLDSENRIVDFVVLEVYRAF